MNKGELREKAKARTREWIERNPEQVKAHSREQFQKGGKRYERTLKYQRTGLRWERTLIRVKHRGKYRQYKKIIAPSSQIHHEWIPDTAEYRGVALVEKDPHQYGIIDPIAILEGKITLLTEAEIRGDK